MKSTGPLILAVLLLASGLTIIFTFGVGTAGFNAAYPFSAANLNLSIATTGPAAVGGLGLTALGLLLLLWALWPGWRVGRIPVSIGWIVLSGSGWSNSKSWSARNASGWNSKHCL